MLQHNVDVLRERYDSVHVISAPGRSYDDLGVNTIYDDIAGLGPLCGYHAALKYAAGDTVAIAACDLQGLRSPWFEQLEQACSHGGAAAFRDSERWHPQLVVLHGSTFNEVETRLRDRRLAAFRFLDDVATPVPIPKDFATLYDVDTREDLRRS